MQMDPNVQALILTWKTAPKIQIEVSQDESFNLSDEERLESLSTIHAQRRLNHRAEGEDLPRESEEALLQFIHENPLEDAEEAQREAADILRYNVLDELIADQYVSVAAMLIRDLPEEDRRPHALHAVTVLLTSGLRQQVPSFLDQSLENEEDRLSILRERYLDPADEQSVLYVRQRLCGVIRTKRLDSSAVFAWLSLWRRTKDRSDLQCAKDAIRQVTEPYQRASYRINIAFATGRLQDYQIAIRQIGALPDRRHRISLFEKLQGILYLATTSMEIAVMNGGVSIPHKRLLKILGTLTPEWRRSFEHALKQGR